MSLILVLSRVVHGALDGRSIDETREERWERYRGWNECHTVEFGRKPLLSLSLSLANEHSPPLKASH